MFIKILNHIINITEIRNVSMENLGYNKFNVVIKFKKGEDIRFYQISKGNADAIMEALTEACLNFEKN